MTLIDIYLLRILFENRAGVAENRTPDFSTSRRNLYRIRSETMPNPPKTASEIVAAYENAEIMQEYGTSVAIGEAQINPFYRNVVSERRFAYCIFASQAIIDRIAVLPIANRRYLMDGTFRVVPYGDFNQLLVIHITIMEKVF